MGQINHGIRRILSSSKVYELFQTLVGAHRYRLRVVDRYLLPRSGMNVIDVGCGTGALLEYLPEDIHYYGFDLSAEYISHAKKRFGHRAQFYCEDVADASTLGLPKADLIVATGLLHHLEDVEATNLISDISRLLAPGGKCVAIDGCFEEDQSRIARWFLSHDRGQNIRNLRGYLALTDGIPVKAKIKTSHTLLRIPYTHSILEVSL